MLDLDEEWPAISRLLYPDEPVEPQTEGYVQFWNEVGIDYALVGTIDDDGGAIIVLRKHDLGYTEIGHVRSRMPLWAPSPVEAFRYIEEDAHSEYIDKPVGNAHLEMPENTWDHWRERTRVTPLAVLRESPYA